MHRNDEQIRRDVYDYLPHFYQEFRESEALLDGEVEESRKLHANIRDVLDQLFVDTATWGLKEWERTVGITDGEKRPDASRRLAIKSKLRGKGTLTKRQFESVLHSFSSEVSFAEIASNYEINVNIPTYLIAPDLSYYTVEDFRVGNRIAEYLGEPIVDMDDFVAILQRIIPSHLTITFNSSGFAYDISLSSYRREDEATELSGDFEQTTVDSTNLVIDEFIHWDGVTNVAETYTVDETTSFNETDGAELFVNEFFATDNFEVYEAGDYTSDPIDVRLRATIGSFVVSWSENLPAGASVTVEMSVSDDGGETFGAYFPVTNGAEVPELSDGFSTASKRVKYRVNLGSDRYVSPELSQINLEITD